MQRVIIKNKDIIITKFKDGEVDVCIHPKKLSEIHLTHHKKATYIHKTNKNFNEDIIALLLTLDALKRESLDIELIITYMPYARKDRTMAQPTSCSIKVILDAISKYVNKIYIFESHFDQIEALGNIKTLEINVLSSEFNKIIDNYDCIVAPDFGMAKKVIKISRPHHSLVFVNKHRPKAEQSNIVGYIGDFKDKKCIIIDDIIASGSTVMNVVDMLIENGAAEVSVFATHMLGFYETLENIKKSKIKNLYATNSITYDEQFYEQFNAISKISILNIDRDIENILINE